MNGPIAWHGCAAATDDTAIPLKATIIDELFDIIGGAASNSGFNFDGNGGVDVNDLFTLIYDILGTWFGDANLDGSVNAADMNVIGLNWQDFVDSWGQGDLNGDGFVDAVDLNLLGMNWLSSNGN